MNTIASQITSLMIVYSTFYSDADQSKHQSSASLAFVWGIHRDRWIPRTKGQLRGKCFHLMTSSWTVKKSLDAWSRKHQINPNAWYVETMTAGIRFESNLFRCGLIDNMLSKSEIILVVCNGEFSCLLYRAVWDPVLRLQLLAMWLLIHVASICWVASGHYMNKTGNSQYWISHGYHTSTYGQPNAKITQHVLWNYYEIKWKNKHYDSLWGEM